VQRFCHLANVLLGSVLVLSNECEAITINDEDATTMYVTVALTDMKDGGDGSTRRGSGNVRKPSNV